MRQPLGAQQSCALARGQRREEGRLAAGAGAEVQPALVASVDLRPRQRERDQLRAFVLNPCPALRHRRHRGRVPGRELDAVR